jgi:ComF family protein
VLFHYLHLLENWLFTTQCLLCHATVKTGKNLCTFCIDELPWNHIACQQCGISLESIMMQAEKSMLCGQCLANPPPFAKTYAAFTYQIPITQLIAQLKFNQNLTCGSVLSELLLKFLRSKYQQYDWPEAIIPVPLHPKRLAERGYNQAIELANPLEKSLNIPVYFDLCARIKQTLTQTAASAKERRANLKNAFTVVKPHHLTHVAIVDDVLTTGSTVTALAKALKNSGVKRIDVWAIAKTIQPNAMIKNQVLLF